MNILYKSKPYSKSKPSYLNPISSSNENAKSDSSSFTNLLTSFRLSLIKKSKAKRVLTFSDRPLIITRTLAETKNSTTYEVTDENHKPHYSSRYALKTIPLQGGSEKRGEFFEIEQRARIEINALRSLRHTNLVPILESEWGDSHPDIDNNRKQESRDNTDNGNSNRSSNRFNLYCHILFPLYDCTLESYIQLKGPLSIESTIEGIFSGLRAIHSAGISHNNITPSNILLQVSGKFAHPVISGFGSVGPLKVEINSKWDAKRQKTFREVHTDHNYRSPETWMIRPKTTLGEKVDVFSLGCTVFYIIFGKHAYSSTPSRNNTSRYRSASLPKNHTSVEHRFLSLTLGMMLYNIPVRMTLEEAIIALKTGQASSGVRTAIRAQWDGVVVVPDVVEIRTVTPPPCWSDSPKSVTFANDLTIGRIDEDEESFTGEKLQVGAYSYEYDDESQDECAARRQEMSTSGDDLIPLENIDANSHCNKNDWVELFDNEENTEPSIEIKEKVVLEVDNSQEDHSQQKSTNSTKAKVFIVKSGPLRQKRRFFKFGRDLSQLEIVWKTVYLEISFDAQLSLKPASNKGPSRRRTLFRANLLQSDYVHVSLVGTEALNDNGNGYVFLIHFSDSKKSSGEKKIKLMAKDKAEALEWIDCIHATWRQARERTYYAPTMDQSDGSDSRENQESDENQYVSLE